MTVDQKACVTVVGQGINASTILTNKSKNITVVTDQPFHERHHFGDKSFECSKYRKHVGGKGTRLMHASTLTFEKNPENTTPKTNFQESYNGRTDLPKVQYLPVINKRTSSQVLHKANFKIGINDEVHHRTHKADHYVNHDIKPASVTHIDRDRWMGQMLHGDMSDILAHKHNKPQQSDRETTYNNIHNTFGKARMGGPRSCPAPQARTGVIGYNVLTGQPNRILSDGRHPLISGNKKLAHIRNTQLEPLLQ